jgi:hypothetical protein
MIKVAFSPRVMALLFTVPRVPSSQPTPKGLVSKHTGRIADKPHDARYNETNTPLMTRPTPMGVMSSPRPIEVSNLLNVNYRWRDREQWVRSPIALLVWCMLVVEPAWICVRLELGDDMVGLPVYSMETSSCFLGVVTPSPGFSMIFSTPMLVTDVDIGINGERLGVDGVVK